MGHLDLVRQTYNYLGLDPVISCSPQEITALEKRLGCALPAAYREFLEWMGQSAGGFLKGSFCFYKDLFTLKNDADRLLKDNRIWAKLPKDAIVFWMHQGYQFLFFCASEGEDPPVHYYNEAEHKNGWVKGRYPNFSEFMIREVIGHAQIVEQLTGVPNHSSHLYPQPVPVHPRDFDAEIQVLQNLIEQFGGEDGGVYDEPSGPLRIVVEQEVCISCQLSIRIFQQMYPNLSIEIALPKN